MNFANHFADANI